MPVIPCPESIPCIDPATPVTNYSTEAPDPNTFFSLIWPLANPDNPVGGGPGQNLPPPVWFADGCEGQCSSSVSQAAADECAAAQAEACVLGKGGQQSFCSNPQACSTICPDGSVFTFTLGPCTIIAASQAAADAQAQALACAELQFFLQCPSCMCNFTPATLPTPQIGTPYSVQFQAVNCLPGPLSWQVVSGALPPGLSLDEESGILSGTPTTSGTFNFTIQLQTTAT